MRNFKTFIFNTNNKKFSWEIIQNSNFKNIHFLPNNENEIS